jgi:alpha-L-rhamnosidase
MPRRTACTPSDGTVYSERLRYQTYDLTGQLRAGDNVLGFTVAEGWYRGRLGFRGGRSAVYGGDIGPIAQLELHYGDGRRVTVATDGSWRAAPDARLAASLYDGEVYDARLVDEGWATTGYDDSAWIPVTVLASAASTMVAPSGPPVRRIETLRPVAIDRAPSGATVVDFGQNITGRARVSVRGVAGEEITLRHAEVLEEGELATWLLRTAAATERRRRPLARLPRWRRHRGRRLPLRHGADRILPLLPRRAQPAPRERAVEHARQLRRRSHRLPAA